MCVCVHACAFVGVFIKNVHVFNYTFQVSNTLYLYSDMNINYSYFFQSLQTDVKSSEVLLHKTNDTGKMLMQNTDLDTQNKIQADLNELQKKWEGLIGEIDTRQHDLETVIHQWEETEEGMEDLFEWLKDIRKSLTHELPDNYDDLLRELQMCKVS